MPVAVDEAERRHGGQRILRSMSASEAGQTLYDAVGGMAFFEALVGRFYDVPHKFTRPMQEDAFAWFERQLSA